MNPNLTPYEIIIICSFGTMFCGCLLIWGYERISHRSIVARKHREPLLNLLEGGDGISKIDKNRSLSVSSSGSETTSFFTTNMC